MRNGVDFRIIYFISLSFTFVCPFGRHKHSNTHEHKRTIWNGCYLTLPHVAVTCFSCCFFRCVVCDCCVYVCGCARETSFSLLCTQYIRLKNSTSDKGNKSSLMLYLLLTVLYGVCFFPSSSSFSSSYSAHWFRLICLVPSLLLSFALTLIRFYTHFWLWFVYFVYCCYSYPFFQ